MDSGTLPLESRISFTVKFSQLCTQYPDNISDKFLNVFIVI